MDYLRDFNFVTSIIREAGKATIVNKDTIKSIRLRTDKQSVPIELLPSGITVSKGERLGGELDISYLLAYPEGITPFGSGIEAPEEKYVLFLHGGGFCIYNTETYQGMIMKLSLETGAVVVAINYRRAPEFPYPAPDDDCFEAYKWLLSKVNKEKVYIAGDSAGGALALGVMLRARDDGVSLPRGAILLSPLVEYLNKSDDSWKRNSSVDISNAESSSAYFAMYASGSKLVSPIERNLDGLPPILVEYGEFEVLNDQIKEFVVKARKSGVQISSNEYKRMVHVFQAYFYTTEFAVQESFNNIKLFMQS